MKAGSFFKSLSWLIFLNLLIKPVWIFGIDRKVQNLLGHETYGHYFALFNITYVLLFIADAGLSNMLNQRVASKEESNTQQLLRIKLLLLCFYTVVCCFIGWLTHTSHWWLLLYIIAIQVLLSLFVFLRSLLTAHQFFYVDAWLSIIDKGLLILLCSGFIYGLFSSITLLLFLQLQIICTGLACMTAFYFLWQRKVITATIKKQPVERLLQWTAPFAFIILLMSAHYRLDGFLLERLQLDGALQAGIYASAFRLLDAGNMVGYLAASFLVPYIARHQADKNLLARVILTTRHGLIFFSTIVVAFAIIFTGWIQQVLYHSADDKQLSVFQLCLLSLPAYYLTHLYGAALTATRQFKVFITVLLVSVTINIVLNLIVIPGMGAAGCCIAALVSQYTCGVSLYVAVHRKLHITDSFKWLLLYAVVAVMATVLFYISKTTMLPVWLILVLSILFVITLFVAQQRAIKNFFASIINK